MKMGRAGDDEDKRKSLTARGILPSALTVLGNPQNINRATE
jgi:hypothetical protein